MVGPVKSTCLIIILCCYRIPSTLDHHGILHFDDGLIKERGVGYSTRATCETITPKVPPLALDSITNSREDIIA